MLIDVISSVNEARTEELTNRTVIVIDVLRATSTIITALNHGCAEVLATETVNGAKAQQHPEDRLGGERSCRKIPGFHYGNSPLEYTADDLKGRKLIITTTNGTRAVQKAHKASRVLIGAFLNAGACARTAFEMKKDIVILCSGTQDVYALEDGLCAGALVHALTELYGEGIEVNDFGLAMNYAFLRTEGQLQDVLLGCSNGKRLMKLGFREDVIYCSQFNVTEMVPVLVDSTLVPHLPGGSKKKVVRS